MKDNIETVLTKLFQALKVQYTTKNLRRNLLSHPDYPSLQGITGVLDEYKVSNLAFRTTTEQLQQMECPVLLYLTEHNGSFGLLHGITKEEVILTTDTNEKNIYPIPLFEKIWSGIAILAETSEQSGEPAISLKPKSCLAKTVQWLMFVGLLLLLVGASWQTQSITLASLFVVKIIAIGFVTLLASHELGLDTTLSDKLCTLRKSTGCNEVLKSKASSLFGIVKLADIGLVYFASTTTALAISSVTGVVVSMQQLLAWLSVLSLPFIAFSVIYQLVVVKKWCPFCMGIAGMLATEATLALTTGSVLIETPTLPSAILVAFCTLIVSLLWMVLKPLLQEKIRLERFEFLYTRLKRKPEVIKGILAESDVVCITPFHNEVVLGNPNASFIITEVVNPYCRPCATSFEKLKSLIDECGDKVRVQLRFLVPNNLNNQGYQVSAHMIALSSKLTPEEMLESVANWFSTTDYAKWIAQYPVELTDKIHNELAMQNYWADSVGVNATPTIYVNGYNWKLDMDLYDLKYSL